MVAMAKIKDNYTCNNVKDCMLILGPQLQELSNQQWDGKKIVLFMFGNYDFQSKLYGISGAQCLYPCLSCMVPRAHKPTPCRKLSLCARWLQCKEDFRRFLKYRHGLNKNVSRYHNCLHLPLLHVEQEHCAPPYPHILLGIVLKHHRKHA